MDQQWLIRFLEHRVGDKRILRLIQKWLKVGVLEDGIVTVSETGTGQGAVISPLLANIYLHYVFDLWAEQWRGGEAQGDMIMVRYADKIVLGFEHKPCEAPPGGYESAAGKVFASVTPGQDPTDRVWPLCGGPTRPGGFGKAGDLRFSGVHQR